MPELNLTVRGEGLEPPYQAPKARVLPLNEPRMGLEGRMGLGSSMGRRGLPEGRVRPAATVRESSNDPGSQK